MKSILLCMLLSLSLVGQAQVIHEQPHDARLITGDIDNFWQAHREYEKTLDPSVFEKHYLQKGSLGLSEFWKLRIFSATDLASTISRHSAYYRAIQPVTMTIGHYEGQIRSSFDKLKALYPEAVFPDVYFVIGRMNSGGTISDKGLFIGTEMYGKHTAMPIQELSPWHQQVLKSMELIPHIVAHELVHFQQSYIDESSSLLALSLKEGVADFVAELISGQHINPHVHIYANPREQALWKEFKQRMFSADYDGWLYSAGENGRPADLGYWMGYKIAKAYYENAENKRLAIADMFVIEDFSAFLQASGYDEK